MRNGYTIVGMGYEACEKCDSKNNLKECKSCTFSKREDIKKSSENEDDGNFLMSAAIGAVTDSALLGGLIGGSFTGAIVGDMLDGDLFD